MIDKAVKSHRLLAYCDQKRKNLDKNLKIEEETKKLADLFDQIRTLQKDFYNEFGVPDLISNSKVFEVMIGNGLGHRLIPGHSGSRDAMNQDNEEYEYKHYKELSSNHSWTFNDYSDSTISKLNNVKGVIFAHIDDTKYPPGFDWYYDVSGSIVSNYLAKATGPIRNTRKMINISPKQLEESLGVSRLFVTDSSGRYKKWLDTIFYQIKEIEKLTKSKNILTSNKIWEILVGVKLGHSVSSEQGGREGAHDAVDREGNLYEYKVSDRTFSWNFQDISEKVLQKYLIDKSIILAVVDKDKLVVNNIFLADSKKVVVRLKEKLGEKILRFKQKGGMRRLQVSLSRGDLARVKAKSIFRLQR